MMEDGEKVKSLQWAIEELSKQKEELVGKLKIALKRDETGSLIEEVNAQRDALDQRISALHDGLKVSSELVDTPVDFLEDEISKTNLLTYNNNNSQTWNSWNHINNKSRKADVFVYNNPKGGKSNPLIQFAVNIPKPENQSKFKSDRIDQFFDMNSSLFNGRVYYIGIDKSGSLRETSRVNFAIYYNKINSDEIDQIIKHVVNHIIMVSIGLQQIP